MLWTIAITALVTVLAVVLAMNFATPEKKLDRKIERELGWRPAETFHTGIRKTVQWYLDNPDWIANVQSGAYRDWVARNYAGREVQA